MITVSTWRLTEENGAPRVVSPPRYESRDLSQSFNQRPVSSQYLQSLCYSSLTLFSVATLLRPLSPRTSSATAKIIEQVGRLRLPTRQHPHPSAPPVPIHLTNPH